MKNVSILASLALLVFAALTSGAESSSLSFSIKPAAIGEQLVRSSVPLRRGFLHSDETLFASDGRQKIEAAVRALSWYQVSERGPKSVRHAIVTFPYTFKTATPVEFNLTAAKKKPHETEFPIHWALQGESLKINFSNAPPLKLRFVAPGRTSLELPSRETVESNAFYRWERLHFPDPQWPRMIEVRSDLLGEVVVVAHLQRDSPGDARAPEIGWEVEGTGPAFLDEENANAATPKSVLSNITHHSYTNGGGCALYFGNKQYCVYHPAAPLKRRGFCEAQQNQGIFTYRYVRCVPDEKVPMQSMAWQRAEIVISPSGVARLKPSLQSPHEIKFDSQMIARLYGVEPAMDLKMEPELERVLEYHHDAIIHSMAVGDDWGNVLSYTDGRQDGGIFGMNRLNHCPAIFLEGWRSSDNRLIETALLWCDNFYDQSIWWGQKQYGGTRYNNITAQGRTPPDDDKSYMWRSNDSVNFCTKGYDSFWLAYEATGDPRMLEALEAQVRYAAEYVHANTGECRNIGDAREFIRLHFYTGEKKYFDEALRLFKELRSKVSTDGLFDQGGKEISTHPPFIDDDDAGLKIGYAKPYIIGYALAGLPELAPFAPGEPRLKEVISSVADFIAGSQDPLGGWRYPHPRSSYLILNQGIEHAWQLVQADRFLGPQEKHLDAIERVLRQRILTWRKTGKILSGLGGWETATGKIKERKEIYKLYAAPEERSFDRDYREGSPGLGSCPPEGLVYFPEVLSYYLTFRPSSRLLSDPKPDDPLGQVLSRVN